MPDSGSWSPDESLKRLCRWRAVELLLLVVQSFGIGSAEQRSLSQHAAVQRQGALQHSEADTSDIHRARQHSETDTSDLHRAWQHIKTDTSDIHRALATQWDWHIRHSQGPGNTVRLTHQTFTGPKQYSEIDMSDIHRVLATQWDWHIRH